MTRRLPRALALLAFPIALAAGACTERLQTADGCPLLCPGQEIEVHDTILTPAYVFDTTLAPYPLQGFEQPLLLAARGDTLDVRTIIRFDTLTRAFTPPSDTSRPVSRVDSATLRVKLTRTSYKVPRTFALDVYDVGDTTLVDSLPANLLPFFTAARLIGTVTVDSTSFTDTVSVKVPLDTAKLLQIITSGRGLRVGVQLRSTEPGEFWITPSDDNVNGPQLRYRVSTDTLVPAPTLRPSSTTPKAPLNLNGDYLDYSLVAAGIDPRAANRFAVGGMPAVRTYVRFDLPRFLTDSAAVLRAQLELVQDPVYGLDQHDSVTVRALLVLAGHATTDLYRATRLVAPAGYFVTDSIRRAPGDSGIVRIEVNGLFRAWRKNAGLPDVPSALVFKSDREGYAANALRFWGVNAAPALRPRIRVSYVPTLTFGQP